MLINKYQLEGDHQRSDPSCDMAESWCRLREGKHIQLHDLTLLCYEVIEHDLTHNGMSYTGVIARQVNCMAIQKG